MRALAMTALTEIRRFRCVQKRSMGVDPTLCLRSIASVEAGARRFIPSDDAMDFPKIAQGLNRNLKLDFTTMNDTAAYTAEWHSVPMSE